MNPFLSSVHELLRSGIKHPIQQPIYSPVEVFIKIRIYFLLKISDFQPIVSLSLLRLYMRCNILLVKLFDFMSLFNLLTDLLGIITDQFLNSISSFSFVVIYLSLYISQVLSKSKDFYFSQLNSIFLLTAILLFLLLIC